MAHSPTIGNHFENIFWPNYKLPTMLPILFANFFKFIGKWSGILGILVVFLALSPILLLLLFFTNRALSKLNRKSEKLKSKFEREYKTFSFDKLKEEESELEKVLLTLKEMKDGIPPDTRILRSVNKNLNAIVNNLEYIRTLLKSRYTLSKDDVFDSDEEFEEYQKAMATLNDVWGYKSTKEEQEYLFKHKNK